MSHSNFLLMTKKLYSCYDITCADDFCIAIKRLCDWSTVWQLNIAVEKCFTCCITSNRMSTAVSQHRYMIIDKVLHTVETVRDLAVIVVHCLKFDAHIFYCACAWLELDFHLSSDVLCLVIVSFC